MYWTFTISGNMFTEVNIKPNIKYILFNKTVGLLVDWLSRHKLQRGVEIFFLVHK